MNAIFVYNHACAPTLASSQSLLLQLAAGAMSGCKGHATIHHACMCSTAFEHRRCIHSDLQTDTQRLQTCIPTSGHSQTQVQAVVRPRLLAGGWEGGGGSQVGGAAGTDPKSVGRQVLDLCLLLQCSDTHRFTNPLSKTLTHVVPGGG